MGDFVIREARADDRATIFDLAKALCEFVRLEYDPALLRQNLEAERFADDSDAHYLVAESAPDKKIVGYCMYYFISCSWSGKGIFLEELSIDPGFRGQGAGSALLEECYRKAELQGANRIELICPDWNTKAVNFYKRYGAVNLTTGTSANVFCIDGKNVTNAKY